MNKSIKQRYITSAFLLLVSSVIVKVIGAVYKIPLTNYIGAVGRGYFSIAYNLCMPIHALTMGAFPIALTKLVSSYEAKGETKKIISLRFASKRLFFFVGILGMTAMIVFAKPYSILIAGAPKSIYTIIALAPSVFFSCLAASHRAFAEGYLDMKPTAISQIIDVLFKTIFGLLLARFSMGYLFEMYQQSGAVFGITAENDEQALSLIYPVTSAFAMLGAVIGSFFSYIFAAIYTNQKYNFNHSKNIDKKSAYNDILAFSGPLIAATLIQSIANFIDTSSIQYCLNLCDEATLSGLYNQNSDDIYTYVFGIYSAALDFKNLISGIVMALGVTAVPAVSSAYESGAERFSPLLTSILKYTAIISCGGGLVLSLYYNDMLNIFYGNNNGDIVENASKLLFWFGVTSLPSSIASTSVFCVQSLGYSKNTVLPFAFSAILRGVINYILISNVSVNIVGSAFSNFFGYLLIFVCNLVTISKKTNAKMNYVDMLIKPIVSAAATYFITLTLSDALFVSMSSTLKFMCSIAVCLLCYLGTLFLMKSITLDELKNIK
ncbi:MAG: oligosaccharide flippase family protein [Clostridiales bacterium]|nr:oligosaccharide flippase family protein [Clostridiales bacterium]